MVEVLNKWARPAGLFTASDRGFWPVDKVVLPYYAAACVPILLFWNRLPGPAWLLTWHLAAIALALLAIRGTGRASWIFRHWYPLPYVAWCYREMAAFMPALRGWAADGALARLDRRVWGVNPTVWLERFTIPLLTEYLQIIYALFVPVVLLIAYLLWRRARYADFRYYAFVIALGFLVSYLGYVLVPARGPRFFLRNLQTVDLRGLWVTRGLQLTLDRLEMRAWDCFPSGHTELTILAWWYSRMLSERLFWIYFAYTLSIISATVYLRYHYTIDLLAGAAVAGLLVLLAPPLYRVLGKGAA
ncbi:MAG TPA: phosphatase PAP2 family protein [Bryobacteraceae bacterium]|nr:phosphatase PAP2 family protein [Bryobacteraceae bacterium]